MTFQGRLRLFFTLIVVVPMVAIAVVLFALTADSERGKADAALSARLQMSLSLYGERREAAARALARVASDERLQSALSGDDRRAAAKRLRELLAVDRRIVSATLLSPVGEQVARAGSRRSVATAERRLLSPRDRRLGTLSVSVTDAGSLVRAAARRAQPRPGARDEAPGFMIFRGDKVIATTVPGLRKSADGSGDFEVEGREYRGRRAAAGRSGGLDEEIAVVEEAESLQSAITSSRQAVGAIIAAFLLLALAGSVLVTRALRAQVGEFLTAASSLASGQFTQRVPTHGRDEFAQLGHRFNSMAEQLATMVREIKRKRAEQQETIRRLGETFASGLEPQQFVEFIVQTALQACEADSARATPTGCDVLAETHAGLDEGMLTAALEEAERRYSDQAPASPRAGSPERVGFLHGIAALERNGIHAAAMPIAARLGGALSATQVAVLAVARRREVFSREESQVLRLLCGLVGVWLENAASHAELKRLADTDARTGLANDRQMDRTLEAELERQRRFQGPTGLVWLDIDKFKSINDTYDHEQGNAVLVAIGGVLSECSRNIDMPVRYHGDELGVVLPGTNLDGAEDLANRMRKEIAALRIPCADGSELGVTASFGVASAPEITTDRERLLKAADRAMYRAKRAGGNRVERATPADAREAGVARAASRGPR